MYLLLTVVDKSAFSGKGRQLTAYFKGLVNDPDRYYMLRRMIEAFQINQAGKCGAAAFARTVPDTTDHE